MEQLRKARGVNRTSITKLCNKIDVELNKEDPEEQLLKAFKERLFRLRENIQTQDKNVLDDMIENDLDGKEIEEESEHAEYYQESIELAIIKINDCIKTVGSEEGSYMTGNNTVLNHHDGSAKRTYKLPKIEIKKFNGELLEWLSFWSQFKKIHEDKTLHDSDKFQYLTQSIEERTRAKELVDSYPQTAENYPKVIDALQERFGKKKILKQVYVRELIKMIVTNVRSNDKIALTKLYDSIESHLRALESLGVTIEQTSEFLFPMVESSLPEDILIAWQRSVNFGRDGLNQQPPKTELDFLMGFLKQEVESEQQRGLARAGFMSVNNKTQEKKKTSKSSTIHTAASLYVGETDACVFCNKNHPSHDCGKGMNMVLKSKQDLLKEKGACPRYTKCSGCYKQHFHIMCPDSPKNKETTKPVTTAASNHNSVINMPTMKQVLLKTILVKIKSKFGEKTVRILFDDGSQQSYVKTSTVKALKCLEHGKYFERNTLFGGVLSNIEERTVYQVQLESLNGKVKRNLDIPAKKQLTGEILKIPDGPWIDELKQKNIDINDYNSSGEDVDILIGADLHPFLVMDQSMNLKCGLKAVKTIFGWTVLGPVPVQNNIVTSHVLSLAADQLDNEKIKNLWDLELLGIQDTATKKSQEERNIQAQAHFDKTVQRKEDGRYVVALPWIDGCPSIPNNFDIARKRLISVTRKLKAQNMFDTYTNIFKQWEDEGIIEEVHVHGNDMSTMKGHFIPHHAVFKLESKTTPVRPVFDASCKVGRCPSLNECLEKGPNLIELIPTSMFHFRENKIGVLSDIRKAFLMIEVQEHDQIYLMFLWWEDQTCTKIKVFKHKRVVFGVKSSPFILGAVLKHHLNNVPVENKEIAQKLLRSLYVDNSITSVKDWDEYHWFKQQAVRLLADARMELRQWEHNETTSDDTQPEVETDSSMTTSVLGMKWNKENDTLSCMSIPSLPEQLTKRTLLASINKLFDPLGFFSPAMIFPKLMLQSLWEQKIDWDDELPTTLSTQFNRWCGQLQYLAEVEIPRYMKGKDFNAESSMQIHVFNDASQLAYATAIFLRAETDGIVSVQLIQAKARIAPINKMTIPRLELMACVTGARLASFVKSSLTGDIPYYFWTDSTTALAWIQRNDEWGTFVGNRVRDIVKLTDTKQWFHVPGIKNPADLPSRGCSPKELLQSQWWEGPDWLRLPKEQWPNEEFLIDENLVNEEKKSINVTVTKNVVEVIGDPWFAKRGSYLLCLRILAWINRFKDNCVARTKNLPRRVGKFLSMKEIYDAELTMVGLVQNQAFSAESNFISGLRVARKNDLLCVVTKLTNRPDVGRFKEPLLLPNTHPVTDKIIEEEHLRNGHAGVQFIVSKLREKFWIIHTRKAVKRVVNKCIVCRRFNKRVATVPIAPLPENRVKDAKTFEVSGIDLAGPLHLKDKSKIWIVIFTCAVYRAVHIETVDKIDTAQFILALSRFIYKNGRVAIIYTDNGTNFRKTAKLFGHLDWNKIQNATNIHRIQWIFNPPASPWWGGFWERLIRMLKEYLRKILGHSKLNKVELDTSLSFVEHLLNTRPLTYVSEDPEDFIPLTPAAFIRDINTSEFPEIIVLNENQFQQKYKELVSLKEELRSRFRSEYLGQLVQRAKPNTHIKFEVGDIVLVVDETKKRLEWPMARITQVFSGSDSEKRVARIKTKNGYIVRPFQRLVHLELKARDINVQDHPGVIENSIKLHKERGTTVDKLKKSTIIDDKKEIITKSGRKVKSPLRLQFN